MVLLFDRNAVSMKYLLFSPVIVSFLTIVLVSSCKNAEPDTMANRSFSEKPEQSHQSYALLAVPVSANDSVKETVYNQKLIQSIIDRYFIGSKLSRYCEGDLNNDRKKDLFVIASRPCGEYDGADKYSTCFRSMIFLSDGSFHYKLAASNERIIECSNCEHGIPDISISDNQLVINRHLGSCQREDITEIYEYQSSDKAWHLKKKEIVSFNCNDHQHTKESMQTEEDFGEVKF
ncbi:MAG TPA: hypothetical protein VK151_06195 [Fluviicola sp.]|nr:hypothetical protein [Fluviicola sp.]